MERLQAEICVVGAGFAGLAAARRLVREGRDVLVVEARDRVGGRVWSRESSDGTLISVGGTWLGLGQDRMFELCREAGLAVRRQYDQGDTLLRLNGENHRYQGLVPSFGTVAFAALGLAFRRLDSMARRLPIDRPWDAGPGRRWDATTLGEWVASPVNIPSATARALAETSLGLLFSTDLSQVSLLGALVLARGGDGFEYYLDSRRTETHLVDGGPAALAERMAGNLGDRLVLASPVRRISQTADEVEVHADRCAVRARRVIVTAPPTLASRIDFDPMLPTEHSQLMRRMVPGAIIRFNLIYDRAFWREQGLTGQTTDPSSPIAVTIDQAPESGAPGVLSAYAFGRRAVELAWHDPAERREICLREVAARLGPRAAAPVGFLETDWSALRWSLGGMISSFGTGALTAYGPALRAPVGRVHWAGTERATVMHGLMEGAVRSGERAAEEVLVAESRRAESMLR